jgi:probable F420-dependent oxidoreductase
VAERADEHGFYGVSVQDHIVNDAELSYCREDHAHEDDRTIVEPMQTLALAGAVTENVKLVTGVMVVPYHNAIRLAKEVAALDFYSNGRMIVGVGVGAPRRATRSTDGEQNLTAHGRVAAKEHAAMNVQGHRGRLADETMQVMDAIFVQEAASFHGEHYSFDDFDVFPKPVQKPRPPFWVGGRSDAARRRAVELAEGWYPSQIGAKLFGDGMDWMRHHAAETGRPFPATNGPSLASCIAATSEAAQHEMEKRFSQRFSPEGLASQTLWGSPDDVIAKIQRYVDAGANMIDVRLVPITLKETLESMDLLANEIMPAFAD